MDYTPEKMALSAPLASLLLLTAPLQALEVASSVASYRPVVVTHREDSRVNVIPWGTKVPTMLDDGHFVRQAGMTIWCAPPGYYLVSGDGEIAIVHITGKTPDPDDGDDDDDDDDDDPPPPDLTPFAQSIFEQAKRAGATAKEGDQIAESFRTGASRIRAGAYANVPVAERMDAVSVALGKLLSVHGVPRELKPMLEKLQQYMDEKAKTLELAATVFEHVANGFDAI